MIPLILALSTPPCAADLHLDTILSKIEADGGIMLDLVDIPGVTADQFMVITADGTVWLWPFKDGCLAAPPLPLDQARKVTGA